MSTRRALIDAATKHQVFIQRYGGGVFKEIQPFLKELLDGVEKMFLDMPLAMDTYIRRNRIIFEINQLQQITQKNIEAKINTQMRALAEYEVDFTKRLYENNTISANYVVPTKKQVLDAAFTSIMDARPGFKGTKGLTIGGALEKFGVAKAAELTKTIRTGFALGSSTPEIAEKVTAIIGQKFVRESETLTRTITNHIANQSRNSFYKANSNVLDLYRVIATLDGRTTLTCQALDGQTFTDKDWQPPPYHYNCRTTFIRIPKAEYDIGADRTGQRAARNLKTNKTTTVSAETTYNSWLKAQDPKFQNEILGPTRAKLFRNGMSVDKFVDENYQPINLDQLRSKDNEHIFKKAGL